MNAYYEDGAVHNDQHKELTIGGNVTAVALKQIIAEFFDDDSDSEGCQPVDDAKKVLLRLPEEWLRCSFPIRMARRM